MPILVRTVVIACLAFAIPLSVTAYFKREAIRPYLIADVDTAEGHLLYFVRRG